MIKLLKRLSKRDVIYVLIAVVFIAAQVWLDLRMPDYMSEITLLVQTPGNEISAVLTAGGKMLLCALGSLVAAVSVSILASRIASDFGADTRGALFHKVQSFSMAEVGSFSTASLITRTTNCRHW